LRSSKAVLDVALVDVLLAACVAILEECHVRDVPGDGEALLEENLGGKRNVADGEDVYFGLKLTRLRQQQEDLLVDFVDASDDADAKALEHGVGVERRLTGAAQVHQVAVEEIQI
jgi:hypothetical protein